MKVDEACIDQNVVKIIESLTECGYDLIDKDQAMERAYLLMTLGEIRGVLDLANALKEVLKA